MVDPLAATRPYANLFSAVGPAPSGTLKINSSTLARPPLRGGRARAFLRNFLGNGAVGARLAIGPVWGKGALGARLAFGPQNRTRCV